MSDKKCDIICCEARFPQTWAYCEEHYQMLYGGDAPILVMNQLQAKVAQLENPWVSVDGAENMPLGEWLGLCEDGERHVVRISEISNGMLANVGGCFHFDREKVVAYAPLPEPPK